MSAHNDGGPAFPTIENAHDPHHLGWSGYPGMTLRDYFAASAPITLGDAVVAARLNSRALRISDAVTATLMSADQRVIAFKMLAQLRGEYADAMLAAREVQS